MSRRDKYTLRPDHVSKLSELDLLIQHHIQIAQSLKAQQEAIITVGYGVDLANEQWNVDLKRKVLERVASPN